MSKTSSKKWKAAVIVSIVLALVVLGRVVVAGVYNFNQNREFDRAVRMGVSDKNSPFFGGSPYYLGYREKATMYQMVSNLMLNDPESLYKENKSSFAQKGEFRFTLGHNIKFYNGPSTFEKPVVTLEKGTEIVLNPEFKNLLSPPCGLPTYERGWRFCEIGRILPEGSELKDKLCIANEEDMESLDPQKLGNISSGFSFGSYEELGAVSWSQNAFGFVRTQDLKALWKDFKAAYPEIEVQDASLGDTPVYRADQLMKQGGLYLSPDLLMPLWDWINTVLMLPLLVWLAILAKRKIADKKSR